MQKARLPFVPQGCPHKWKTLEDYAAIKLQLLRRGGLRSGPRRSVEELTKDMTNLRSLEAQEHAAKVQEGGGRRWPGKKFRDADLCQLFGCSDLGWARSLALGVPGVVQGFTCRRIGPALLQLLTAAVLTFVEFLGVLQAYMLKHAASVGLSPVRSRTASGRASVSCTPGWCVAARGPMLTGVTVAHIADSSKLGYPRKDAVA